MLRVLIADDHAVTRRGVKEILLSELDAVTCGEAENADQISQQVRSHHWDLLILDISMPGRSGLDVIGTIRSERPKLPVLVLSMHAEDQYGRRALKAGAAGYMNKEHATEELIKAVRTVLAGGRYVSAALAEALAIEWNEDREPHERLSDREVEVLRRIAFGRTVSQIAADLHLSVPTVNTYRARILEKMGLSTTAEIMHYALRHRLVE